MLTTRPNHYPAKILLFIIATTLLSYVSSFAQNVKISAAPGAPNAAAMLDVDGVTNVGAAYKGILIPRMTYLQRTSLNPLAAVAQGLLVYQTDVSGTSAQGFYYNNSITTTPIWVYLDGTAWDITGNSNVTAASNYIGTNVAQDFVTKTNSTERMRVASAGNIIINNTSIGTNTDDVFSVYANGSTNGNAGNTNISAVGADAINGYSAGTGVGVLGENTSQGIGVAGITTADNDYGVVGVSVSTTANAANFPSGTVGEANSVYGTGVSGFNYTAGGTGVTGTGNNVSPTQLLIGGSGGAFTGSTIGLYGYAASWSNGNPSAGAYLQCPGGSWYVGTKSAAGVMYKIQGTGTAATVVNDMNGNRVVLAAPEAPEHLFMDFGYATLTNGATHVSLDSILATNIVVNDAHPLRVIITPQGNCNQLYYFNSSNYGFDVLESNNGTSNITFTWMIVANRADEVLPDGTVSKYSSERFPAAIPLPTTISLVHQSESSNQSIKSKVAH